MWYQSSLGDVIIHDSVISDKGVCKEKYNDYYIMEKRWVDRQTDIQTDKKTDQQTDRWIDRQIA